MRIRFFITLLAIMVIGAATGNAQILNLEGKPLDIDSVKKDFDNQPYFGLYKDNYFIFGPSLNHPNKTNTNIKFQISIAQRLTKSVLPWGTYLYLFYSQKCFWNVLENSMPMTDLNFNPGVGLTKPLYVKSRYIGKATLMLEHESNGRDSIQSRSWNKVSLAANVMIDKCLLVHGKIWLPIVDGMNNKDILHYCGIYQAGVQVYSPNQRFSGSVMLTKRLGKFLNYNTVIELSYRIFKRDNQYLFLQYYNGYGEGLLEYNKFHNQIRVGIVIKPRFFSEY
ncbi:MAG: phospholipase A [Muribaculaceae bacterium]|nr:phospholipase A [Muribaculaceae bacterium]MDE6702855.1 phospholipase A [Muribaculaceae bacterium]